MSDDGGAQSAVVKVVEEKDATGKVIKIFEEIKTTLGIDFVPNMYRALAVNPDYLEITWRKVQSVMGEDGKLGNKTKDIVALTVSIMSGCDYCIGVYNDAVKRAGLDDQALLELYEVIDLYAGLNRLNIGLQTKMDEKPWHGCGGSVYILNLVNGDVTL
ncbi:MAG: carboxymuconolactone decarboxylase family protein [Candidatus Dadabacteria bacterium]|nr:carboxymuconolactone decarboxylase family protein [Candidatus Dadabacteria bacterium]